MVKPTYISPGANMIYVQRFFNNVAQPMEKLGIAAGGVRRRLGPIWEPAENDAAGRGDVEATFQGVSGIISFTLTIMNEDVVERCKLPLPNLSNVPGYIPPGGIGALLLAGKNYWRVLLYRPLYATLGIAAYINFPACRLANAEDLEDNKEKRVPMVWQVHTPIQHCQLGAGAFYNNDGSGWPGTIGC